MTMEHEKLHSDDTEKSPVGSATEDIKIPHEAMIILPVRNVVLFPGMVVPLTIGRKSSVAAVEVTNREERPIGIITQKDPNVDEPTSNDIYQIGCVATILRYATGSDGTHHLICQGQKRFRILDYMEGYPFFVANVELITDQEISSKEIEAKIHHLKQQVDEALELMPQVPTDVTKVIETTTSAAVLSDIVISFLDIKPEEKQTVLEAIDVPTRLDKVMELMAHRLAVMRLQKEISKQTKQAVDEKQREYILREQLRTIQRELGEADTKTLEIEDITKEIAKAKMPKEAEEEAKRELARLERMPEAATEYSMVRTYLDWLVSLPWSVESKETIDISEARRILDQDHFGLEKIKKRILEYLAVRKLNPAGKSPILCFVGPPGVGKTSLGQSIARATGRKFVRASLGGVHDEAEIRGHRRTYIGALPGNIIQSIRKAGTRNPVFMLDEMDKLGASFHGDPSSALLEVLDPEQNTTFRDNYLNVPFDLSKVMFIGTANVLDSIPGPLRDRMEVIDLPGYTEEEKVQIARRYLVQRQLETNGLKPEQCQIDDESLQIVVHDYTREAGCRNLEREIGRVFRNVAMRIAEGAIETILLTTEDVREILGPRKYESEVAMRTGVSGVATGLAWTPTGGDILFVEASRTIGTGKLILTGQLGDVMKESAQAALSLVKTRMGDFRLTPDVFEKSDIHIHVPAGAIPKDGPSAGVAIYVALVSLFTGKRLQTEVAMTGEISLRGLVLPVGGIKEKMVAAARAGITTILLPARNKKDFEDIPQSARDKLKFIWLENVDDAIKAAIGESTAKQEKAKPEPAHA